MVQGFRVASPPTERLTANRARIAAIRENARRLSQGTSTGIQVTAAISEGTDQFIVDLLEETLSNVPASDRARLEEHSAIIAVGGSARKSMAPYSDVDLLFLYRSAILAPFADWSAQVVRDLWDAGMQLGHSVRTVPDAIAMTRQEPKFATALVDTRLLWGSERLFHQLQSLYRKKAIARRRRDFVQDCVRTRREEVDRHGAAVNQLEPDVKRARGALRDIHLIQWLGFAHYDTSNIDTLRLKGALNKEDARQLVTAHEFLTRIRVDLHYCAGRSQDVLSREEQLRLADERNVAGTAGQLPVERLMQNYFQHTTAVADIAGRFVDRHRPRKVWSSVQQFMMTHRADGLFLVNPKHIDVIPYRRELVGGSLDTVLSAYELASLLQVTLAPRFSELIKESVPRMSGAPSPKAIKTFGSILGRPRPLPAILRSMYSNGILEKLLPEMGHARCLLQFNGYHSYTVDEHTMRVVEAATGLQTDDGPLGTAYRGIRHKNILHLAMLLHDLGKGYDEDHSEVGKRLAERVAARMRLPEHDRDLLVFLVHKHLLMAHIAFRRDIGDQDVLVQFCREVGSPETLKMLYVMTAADVMGVGPGTWTSWKSELLTQLYDSAMLHLSGEHVKFQQRERLERVKRDVRKAARTLPEFSTPPTNEDWVEKQLDAFQRHYLTGTEPERILADLRIVQTLQPDDVVVQSEYNQETGTVEYRVIVGANRSAGCFHRIAGVLTSKRLDILAAEISTTLDETVIDSFRVVDNDFSHAIPQSRMNEVAEAVKQVLVGAITVDQLFPVSKRFDVNFRATPISNLPTRIAIDHESSSRCTIIDVFAHDRPGLLYTLSRAISKLGLSVLLAKISTHVDQVVDVFYVTDADGRKVQDEAKLAEIRHELEACMNEFELNGHKNFVS